ncbi:hypothetical protein [Nocardia abscessus]|uniref:hypothetical protein n=1 Tax=Nocardia abscessus TaxID=120957 RepID=UPI0024554120|nr:hypothetical protein [Nocardia abscessus]
MIDGMAIAAYLAAAIGAASGRWVNGQLDQAFSALTDAVTRRLGRQPVDVLTQNPDSIQARRRVAEAIEREALIDEQFARELSEIRARLDRLGGQNVVAAAEQGGQVVVNNHGQVAGRDNILTNVDVANQDDLSRAPAWAKVCLWVGGAIAAIGFALFMSALYQHNAEPATEFAIFAIGGGLMAVGELGARTSTPRPRR